MTWCNTIHQKDTKYLDRWSSFRAASWIVLRFSGEEVFPDGVL
jgi:hypothetical protein